MRSGFTSTRSSSLTVKLCKVTIPWLRGILLLFQFLFLIAFTWQVCKTHVPSNNKTYLRAKSDLLKKRKKQKGAGEGQKENSVPMYYVNSEIIKRFVFPWFTEQHGVVFPHFNYFQACCNDMSIAWPILYIFSLKAYRHGFENLMVLFFSTPTCGLVGYCQLSFDIFPAQQ